MKTLFFYFIVSILLSCVATIPQYKFTPMEKNDTYYFFGIEFKKIRGKYLEMHVAHRETTATSIIFQVKVNNIGKIPILLTPNDFELNTNIGKLYNDSDEDKIDKLDEKIYLTRKMLKINESFQSDELLFALITPANSIKKYGDNIIKAHEKIQQLKKEHQNDLIELKNLLEQRNSLRKYALLKHTLHPGRSKMFYIVFDGKSGINEASFILKNKFDELKVDFLVNSKNRLPKLKTRQ